MVLQNDHEKDFKISQSRKLFSKHFYPLSDLKKKTDIGLGGYLQSDTAKCTWVHLEFSDESLTNRLF